MEHVSHLSPEEAFKVVKACFLRMADEPAVAFRNAGWTPSGDVMVEFTAKRRKARFKARFGARVSPTGRLRAFSDLDLKIVQEAQGPNENDLARVDAEDAVKSTGKSVAALIDEEPVIFPRAAVWHPDKRQWVVRVAVVKPVEKDVDQYEATVNSHGDVTSLRRRRSPI